MATVYTDKQVKDFINGLVASGLTGAALQQSMFDGAVQYGIPYDQLARTTGYSLADIKAYTQAKGVTLADTYAGVDPTTLFDVTAPPPAPAAPPPAAPTPPPATPAPPPATATPAPPPATATPAPTGTTAYTDKQVSDYIAQLKAQGLTGDALNQAMLSAASQYNIPANQLTRVLGYSVTDVANYAQANNTPINVNATQLASSPQSPTTPYVNIYSDKEVSDFIGNLKAQGLTGDALNQAILTNATKYNITDAQLARVTGYTVSEIQNYAQANGKALPTVDQVATQAANNWAAIQFGRTPTTEEVAAVKDIVNAGWGQAQVNTAIEQYSPESYNYDRERIVSAFRQNYGRNPTDAEFTAALDAYRNTQISADVLAFNKYTPSIVKGYLDQQLQANPGNPDAAYKNVLNKAVELGVTVNELAQATGFDVGTIQQYITDNNLAKLGTYAELRAANPTKTYMQLGALAADPWAGGFATTNPYKPTPDAANVVTLSDGTKIATVRNVYESLDYMNKNATLRFQDVQAAINMSLANGTMTQADADSLLSQLYKTTSIEEGLAVLSQPKAFVVIDPLYGIQIGQAKTLDAAQQMAAKVQPLLIDAANMLGANNAGVAPTIQNVQYAPDAIQKDLPYSPAAVADIYAGYNSQPKTSNIILPNVPASSPYSYQSQLITPMWKYAREQVDQNYNPYAMPDEQLSLPPFGDINPYQRGIDYITRTGERTMYPAGPPNGQTLQAPNIPAGGTQTQGGSYPNFTLSATRNGTTTNQGVYSDDQVKDYITGLSSKGLSGDALYSAILADATKYNVPLDQLSRTTGFSPEQIMNYSNAQGIATPYSPMAPAGQPPVSGLGAANPNAQGGTTAPRPVDIGNFETSRMRSIGDAWYYYPTDGSTPYAVAPGTGAPLGNVQYMDSGLWASTKPTTVGTLALPGDTTTAPTAPMAAGGTVRKRKKIRVPKGKEYLVDDYRAGKITFKELCQKIKR